MSAIGPAESEHDPAGMTPPSITTAAPSSRIRKIATVAGTDLRRGLSLWRVWSALALEDITDQHRRTSLGPIWLLVNYLAFGGTFLFLFSTGKPTPGHTAYVATGLIVWMFMMEMVTNGVTLFASEESMIKGTALPLTLYVLRATLRSVIRSSYSVLGCLVILLASGTSFTLASLAAIAGVVLVIFTAPAVKTVFAFLGVFFPDSQLIISNLMRIAMFVTPVFWQHGNENGLRRVLYDWNPFTHFLDIVRRPIVEGVVPFAEFGVCAIIAALAWVVALLLLGAFGRRVALAI